MNRKYSVKLFLHPNNRTDTDDMLGLMNKDVAIELHGEGIPFSMIDSENNILDTLLKSICYDNINDVSDLQLCINDYVEFDTEFQNIFNQQMLDEKPKITSDMIATSLGGYHKIKKESEYIGDQCSICLCEYKHREGFRILDCKHVFHKKCIDRWFKKYSNANCPICRANIFTS